MIKKYLISFSFISLVTVSCSQRNNDFVLPVLGRPDIIESVINGEKTYDTIEHIIAPFLFHNQDSVPISNDTYKDKIYVADFFFTSCPTICPAMKKQMLRVYKKYKDNNEVFVLSHTIDPAYDSIKVLKQYAEALSVEAPKWNFVTGDKEAIYEIGEKSYMVTAGEDSEAPGGYIHGGAFILVGPKGRIRGVYDGTTPDQVNVLLSDIDWLLKEVNAH